MGRFNQSDAFQNSNQHRAAIEPRLELENQFASFNLNNLTPQVPELTPTNSKGLQTLIYRSKTSS